MDGRKRMAVPKQSMMDNGVGRGSRTPFCGSAVHCIAVVLSRHSEPMIGWTYKKTMVGRGGLGRGPGPPGTQFHQSPLRSMVSSLSGPTLIRSAGTFRYFSMNAM